MVYHQRDRNHRVIQRGLRVRYQSQQREAVLITYALSFSDLLELGDEHLVAETREVLSRAKKVLEHAGLHAAVEGGAGMTPLVTLLPAKKEANGNAESPLAPIGK